jgi:hypothetical protein
VGLNGKPNISVVYKTSSRKNAKTKLIVFENTLVDDIINDRKRKPLLPEETELLDIGVGDSFEKKYKQKYKL